MDSAMPDMDEPKRKGEPRRGDSMPDIPPQRSTSSFSVKRGMSTHSTASSIGTAGRLMSRRGPLEAELVDSYYWSGSLLKDYVFFVRQWHPILAICLHHKRHPYTRQMRVFVFLVTIFFPMFPTALVLYLTEHEHGSPNIGTESWWKIECWIVLPSMLLNTLLYRISVMDRRCAPKLGEDFATRLFGCALRMVATLCKAACYFCVTLTMVAPIITILIYEAGSRECEWCSWTYMLKPWCISMASSFFSWFPMHLFMPITGFLWHWHKERWEGKPPLEKLERLEEINGCGGSDDLLA